MRGARDASRGKRAKGSAGCSDASGWILISEKRSPCCAPATSWGFRYVCTMARRTASMREMEVTRRRHPS